ncbi:MAG TPA: glycoside hydrolase family 2 TIM barrel-domain containing protein [Tepidisphaeraceae bacterium]|nr:glycoside hydrolase family 2 TIM barrel-domain containing protein [Tepidisphaeraceae bacterium]
MRIRFVFAPMACLLAAVCASRGENPPVAPAAAPQGVVIEQVIPFATADSVRFDVKLSSSEPAKNLQVAARIVPVAPGEALWTGSIGVANVGPNSPATLPHRINNLKPKLWEPDSPHLYNLIVTVSRDGTAVATRTTRFGFRSFEVKNAQFHLNGRPIFLRGIAINPPGRGIPPEVGETRKFAEDYVRYMKSRGVNLIRMEPESPVWFDVCDELGMMVFQGRYGAPPTAPGVNATARDGPPEDFQASMAGYLELFKNYPQHPSIVIYVLSNELPRIHLPRGRAWHDFIVKAHAHLKQWSPETTFIGNAGYGEGREGDVNDVHRYWGWYYNSFLTYLNLRDTRAIFGDPDQPDKQQPVTFSECVGNYTGVNGAYNIVVNRQMAAQLGWTGHSENQADDALENQKRVIKQATELFRRLRPQNPRLAGIMPFTILFHHWRGISSFDQMNPKPAMEQLAMSYAPVLLSWEMWTPQVYAGTTISGFAHVINDADDGGALKGATLRYELTAKGAKGDKNAKVAEGEVKIADVPYYGVWKTPFSIAIPEDAAEGDYTLIGRVMIGEKQVTTNTCDLFIASDAWSKPQRQTDAKVALYDPKGKTAKALKTLNLPFRAMSASDLDQLGRGTRGAVVVIGEEAWNDRISGDGLMRFVAQGGRLLVLGQEPDRFKHAWLPVKIEPLTLSANSPEYLPSSRPFREQHNINPQRPWHPVFQGLPRERLRLWSDYTKWDQTKPGFPAVYPVKYGFKLLDPAALKSTAVLANYDRGLEGVALCEMFAGKGSVLLSAFDLVDHVGLDPAADRLLVNLIAYAGSSEEHEVYPLIEKPIHWGDYPTERGLITGPLHGLVINAVWVKPPTEPNAQPLPDNTGAWNTDPGNQFVPSGRRPIGPFGYSTATSLRDPKPEEKTGYGMFYARLPKGRSTMVTTVRNGGSEPATLHVGINGRQAGQPASVAPGTTITVRSPLPGGATEVAVRFAGEKALVLEQTAFE